MYLKKIEIQGFKSFPENTLIEFDTGMTAIVGPNGSGKSNVTDAVRWVLGEQSAKSLRGGKMEDVIFNGTSTRKAMNYAEVTLTLDNGDKYINYDFPEIQITRRLYRSGESEYQINKVNCRLKDIVGLFLDTGIGKDGYSIVGQGRVDEILSTKSEDRRYVIEEAAGIVKYKVRKEEAERKLSQTEQNLLRIDDVLAELNERKGPLEEQSKKAVKYHKAYESMKTKDIALLCHKITEANNAMGDSASIKEQLENEIKEQEDRFIALREENKDMTAKAEQLEDAIEDKRQELSDVTEQQYDKNSDKKILSERRNAVVKDIEESRADNEAAQARIKILELDRKEHLDKAEKILGECNEIKQQSEQLNKERDAIRAEFEEEEKSRSSIRTQFDKKTGELIESRENIKTTGARIEALSEQITRLSEQLNNASAGKAELKKALDEADVKWKEMTKSEGEVTDDIKNRNEKLKALTEKQIQLNKFFEKNNSEFLSACARLRTLKDIEKRKEGYQESVKRLLDAIEGDASYQKRIVGVLGDLISVDKEYETAIEIALGSAIHNVVTPRENDAAELIDLLKTRKLGRVTFLPIENIKPRPMPAEIEVKACGQKGYINTADELVKCDKKLNDIISNLLGRIIIADTLENARNIARKIDHQVKIITLDGDSVNPGGSLTGGSVRKSGAGILGRTREIEELTKLSDELEAKLSDNEENRQEVDDKIGEINKELAILAEQLKYFSMERVKAETEYRNIDAKLGESEDQKREIEELLNKISTEKLRLEDDIEELGRIEKEISNELDDIQQDSKSGDDKVAGFTSQLDDIRDKLAEMSATSERLLAERNGEITLADHIKTQIDMNDQEIKTRTEAITEAEASISEIDKETAEIEKELTSLAELAKKLQEEVNGLMKQKAEVDAGMSGFAANLTSISDSINNLRNKLNNHVSKYEKYITEIDISKNRLWEDYEVTYDNVAATVEAVENPAETAKEISRLRTEIKNIGPVNLDSVEEFRELSDRLDFMTNQRNDIFNAKTDLEKVISDLVSEMQQQFITQFEIINNNFKRVFFDLFGGGTAEIVLDSEDVLECNIEIKAQPPGKKLQSLTLLSGGERCLTAIALLFAILELKPSPFVILDEVEAALDDVNVARFTDFVRRYCVKSQFILVTHRKGTMEACDRMYGVTMAERGISKILSMRLS
ncbi:MAG: chromosome segregation protein SMC [Clostridiales bacterium]|nr:chromosome segregation protein SMC [Clostridiales bacterium]